MCKKVLIVGAGAVGSFYGALFLKAGYDVTFMARNKQLEALKEKGLTIKSYKFGNFSLKVNATDTPNDKYDFLIFCVKSSDTYLVCSLLKNNIKKDSIFASFQNGIENVEIISKFFGVKNTIGASVFIGASLVDYGIMEHSAHGLVTFGSILKDNKHLVDRFEGFIKKTDIEYKKEYFILPALWKKLLWNVAFNPLSTILETTCGRMIKDENIVKLMNDMIDEAVEAARIDGIEIEEEFYKNVPYTAKNLENFKTSMLQDIEKGKNPEIDGILGPVIRKLSKVGKKAPYCDSVYKLVKFKYGKSFLYTPKLTVDMIVVKNNEILLIERKNPPFGWALPGGFVDYGETVENAVKRELLEETNILVDEVKLLGVYSDPKRDNRMHTVSVVYYTYSNQIPKAADDAKNAQFFNIENLPENIAFDHRKIIEDYIELSKKF